MASARPLAFILAMALAALLAAGCGSDDDPGPGAASDPVADPASTGIRFVDAEAGAAILDDPPPGLVVLDVRTAEEFADGHLADATMLDFYADDFADRLAELDPDVPYLVYCRSGSRSGQTRALMEDLGFADVADLEGGIVAWNEAGLPIQEG